MYDEQNRVIQSTLNCQLATLWSQIFTANGIELNHTQMIELCNHLLSRLTSPNKEAKLTADDQASDKNG